VGEAERLAHVDEGEEPATVVRQDPALGLVRAPRGSRVRADHSSLKDDDGVTEHRQQESTFGFRYLERPGSLGKLLGQERERVVPLMVPVTTKHCGVRHALSSVDQYA
jgi:hypothetical protein